MSWRIEGRCLYCGPMLLSQMGGTHEGIDLSFKNVLRPETLSINQITYNGTFDFCVSGEKSLA
jgi:hypothetical protein